MPPPTEQGFQLPISPTRPNHRGRNAPSNRTRISTDPDRHLRVRRNGRNAPSNRTRISTVVAGCRLRDLEVAMPPPTEQGFQPMRGCNQLQSFWVAMPPPTEQGFQRAPARVLPAAPLSQCPLQQNKDFNINGDPLQRPATSRNAPSNRTRISTPPVLQGRSPWSVAMPPPTEQGFQLLIAHDQVYPRGRNASSNRTRIST